MQKHTVESAKVEDLIPDRELNDAETLADDRMGIYDGHVPQEAEEESRIQRSQSRFNNTEPTAAHDPYGEERIATLELSGPLARHTPRERKLLNTAAFWGFFGVGIGVALYLRNRRGTSGPYNVKLPSHGGAVTAVGGGHPEELNGM